MQHSIPLTLSALALAISSAAHGEVVQRCIPGPDGGWLCGERSRIGLPAPGSFAQKSAPAKPSITPQPAPPARTTAAPSQSAPPAPIEVAPTVTTKSPSAPQPTPRPQEPAAAAVTAPREPTPAPVSQTLAAEPATPPRFAGNLRPAADAGTRVASFPESTIADAQNPFCRVLGVEEIAPHSGDRDQLPLDILADQAESIDQKNFNYQGNVRADHGDQRLRADFVHYDSENGVMEAWDNVQLIEPGQHAVGSHARIDQEANTGVLDDAAYRMVASHASGRADQVIKEGDWIRRYVGDATYSTCDPERRSWELKADEVRLDLQEGWGEAWNTKLYLGSVPVFYTPYHSFPIDDRRKSGFLTPSFGSKKAGDDVFYEVQAPWYWNIAPNQDATITPRAISRRGLMLGGQYRYLMPSFKGTVDGEFLLNDSTYNDDRYSLKVLHDGTPADGWTYDINYSRLSDKDYFTDFGNTLGISSTTHLEQTVVAHYTAPTWDVNIKAQDWYTVDKTISTDDQPYQRLPEVTANWARPSEDEQLNWRANGGITYFTHETKVDGSRLHLQPGVSYRKNFMGGAIYLEPDVKVDYVRYDLDSGASTSPTRTTPTYSLTSGLFLEREFEMGSEPNGWFGTQWVQTLEPTLTYTYVPEGRDSELSAFDDSNSTTISAADSALLQDTFVGGDRASAVNLVKAGLTSRLIDQESGQEILTGLIEQGRSLRAQNNKSTILHARLDGHLQNHVAYYDTTWNHYNSQVGTHEFGLELRPSDAHIFNARYLYDRNNNKEQYDLSTAWRLNSNWNLLARYNYELDDAASSGSHELEELYGIAYDTCCWGARMTYQRYQTGTLNGSPSYDHIWFLVLELKGLTGLGSRQSLEETLEQSIIGYTQKPLAAY